MKIVRSKFYGISGERILLWTSVKQQFDDSVCFGDLSKLKISYIYHPNKLYALIHKIEDYILDNKLFNENDWEIDSFNNIVSGLSDSKILCIRFSINNNKIKPTHEKRDNIILICYTSNRIHRSDNGSRKVGTKLKTTIYVHYRHNYNDKTIYHLKWHFYKFFKKYTKWQGTKSLNSAFRCMYKTLKSGTIKNITIQNRRFRNIRYKDYEPYIIYDSDIKKMKNIESFLNIDKNKKYYKHKELRLGCVIRALHFNDELNSLIDEWYEQYLKEFDQDPTTYDYIERHIIKFIRQKMFENMKYVYNGGHFKKLSKEQRLRSQKLANGLRMFGFEKKFSHLTNMICNLAMQCKFMDDEFNQNKDMAAHNKYENGSSNVQYSGIDSHEEFSKFSEMISYNHGLSSRIDIGLKLNSYNGVVSIELPANSFVQWDSLVFFVSGEIINVLTMYFINKSERFCNGIFNTFYM